MSPMLSNLQTVLFDLFVFPSSVVFASDSRSKYSVISNGEAPYKAKINTKHYSTLATKAKNN